jgi:hypothetical protein
LKSKNPGQKVVGGMIPVYMAHFTKGDKMKKMQRGGKVIMGGHTHNIIKKERWYVTLKIGLSEVRGRFYYKGDKLLFVTGTPVASCSRITEVILPRRASG